MMEPGFKLGLQLTDAGTSPQICFSSAAGSRSSVFNVDRCWNFSLQACFRNWSSAAGSRSSVFNADRCWNFSSDLLQKMVVSSRIQIICLSSLPLLEKTLLVLKCKLNRFFWETNRQNDCSRYISSTSKPMMTNRY